MYRLRCSAALKLTGNLIPDGLALGSMLLLRSNKHFTRLDT